MLFKNSLITESARKLPWRAIGRWWVIGVSFYLVGLVILYVVIGLLRVPLLTGTLLTAEATTILRYCINDRWVFEERSLSWTRFWQYHLANAGGFAIWWTIVNVLPHLGVHYLLASTVGTGCSMISTMASNFLWVWRKKTPVSRPTTPEIAANTTTAD
jgi:putative flippase GtrA